jgi:hypothetical protein
MAPTAARVATDCESVGTVPSNESALEESERFATEALDIGTSSGQPDAAVFFGATLGTIRMKQGQSGELLDLTRPIVEEKP